MTLPATIERAGLLCRDCAYCKLPSSKKALEKQGAYCLVEYDPKKHTSDTFRYCKKPDAPMCADGKPSEKTNERERRARAQQRLEVGG